MELGYMKNSWEGSGARISHVVLAKNREISDTGDKRRVLE